MVSKHQTVMEFDGFQSTAEEAVFVQSHDEGETSEEYRMSGLLWREMGSPEIITVTVQPGDLLNPETPADFIGGTRVGGFSAQDL